MTESPPGTAPTFREASRRVVWRLWQRQWLRDLLGTLPWVMGALAVLAALRGFGVAAIGAGWMAGGSAMWVAVCAAAAWWRRPGPYAALAFWDAQAGRGDAFANAWWFERETVRSPGQEHHRATQAALLPAALPALRRDIRLPGVRRLALVPVAIAASLLVPAGGPSSLPDVELGADGRRLAGEEGRKLAEKRLDAERMKALSEAEKKEVDKLQAKVGDTARALQRQEAKTAREVLSELEKRAHEAESLAGKLGAGADAWASEQMVAAMRRHADTAELGDAVANKSTEGAAREAQKLADQLRDAGLTNEVRDRVAETLRDVGKVAEPRDRERTVGQHVLNADRNLGQALPKDAGDEFQKLADKMRTLAAREKAREQLEKLAQQLREAGSKVAGQGAQGMEKLADTGGSQSQQGAGSQQMTTMPNAPPMQAMPVPGLSGAPQGQGQQGTGQSLPLYAPVPGTGKGSDQKLALRPGQPGGGGEPGKPMLLAPIPGTDPGQQPSVAVLGMSAGGNQAGSAKADLGNKPTEPTKAGQQGIVDARRNAEGQSAVRAVEGRAHAEAAGRAPQAAVLEAIAAEENALDDAALPAARREQVRRYFTELRKRFEKDQ